MASLEKRLEALEAAHRARLSAKYPPRFGLLLADDYSDDGELQRAIDDEMSKLGTVGVNVIEFFEGVGQ